MATISQARRVDRIADTLVRKFNAPNSRDFFCLCGWNMSEDEIWTLYEKANGPKVKYPLRYFIFLCNQKFGNKPPIPK